MRVLNARVAREDGDEKHLAPLPLDIVERLVRLYSNPDETVFSPFAGIGSDGVPAVRLGRRFQGVELKERYWSLACRFLAEAEAGAGK
jgi:DNA modification methylase